ncbi:RNA polymerase sigma factor [Flavobacteriaceae bacterium F08102]|nr:RNA polymerase sigma factor [Flavobacteriaceae bacterium F08102]
MNLQKEHITHLLQRCEKGDISAQFEIYEKYYKAMYNTSFRILKNSFEAEDVMQESFLIAFTKLSTFKGEVTFGAWLKRIVINKSITQLRKNNRIDEVGLEVVKELPDQEVNEVHCDSVSVETIKKGINQLKDKYRLPLTLHLIEGYDHEEIAGILSISNQNSRTTISRAKQKLRTLLHIKPYE